MAANDRETTFTIKAADLSTQEINKVIQTVERLIAVQEKMNQASNAGTVNTNESRKALKDLEIGAKAVADQITTLQRAPAIIAELEKRLATVAGLQARLAEAQAKPEGERTKREIRDIERLEKQIDSATKSVDRQNVTWEAAQARMKAMGTSVETMDADMARLRATADQLTGALTRAGEASLTQVQNRQAAAAAAQAQAEAEKRLAAEEEAFVLRNRAINEERAANDKRAEADMARLAETSIRLRREQIAAAFEERDAEVAAAKAATKQREADMEAAQRQYNFEQKLLRESLRLADERLAKEKELAEQRARIEVQRNLAVEAIAKAPAPTPLGAVPGAEEDFSKVSRGLSAIIEPAAAARQTIDGLIAEIDKLANAIDSAGKNRSTKDLANDLRAIGIAAQELKRQGGLIDAFQAQEAATLKAKQALDAELASMERLRHAGLALTAEDKDHVKAVRDTEAAIRKASEAFEAHNTKLTQQRGELGRAGIDYHNLDEEISRLRASATATGGAFEKVTKQVAGKSDISFLGLRPYELQNLSYQINDVFTQLGSGTPVTQVFAQQGGQIFQLFQKQLLEALKTLREIPGGMALAGAAGVALVVVFAALGRAMEDMAAKRAFAAELAGNVDGATHSVQALVEASKEAEKLGAALSDATAGAKEFVKVGIPDAQIAPMLALVTRMTNAYGTKFKDQQKEVTSAFTGSYEAMRKFTAQYGYLTEAEDKHIKSLYDENRAEEARAEALRIVTERVKMAEEQGMSPFQKSVVSLTNAWHKLLEAVGYDKAWTDSSNFLATTMRELEGLINLANKVGSVFGWLNDKIMGTAWAERIKDRVAGNPDVERGTSTQSTGTARGDRNNNPGNLEFRDQIGAVREGGSGRFAKFEDQEAGVAAALRQYLLYQERDKLTSVQAMVEKATPPKSKGGDNPDEVVRKYVEAVAKELGVGIKDAINLRDRDTAVKYIQAVARQEGNRPPTTEVAQAGVGRVLGGGGGDVNNRAIATRNFVQEQERELAARRRQFMTEGELLQQEIKDIEESNEKIAKLAQERAGHENLTELERTEVARIQNENRKVINKQYAEERVRRETEVTSTLKDLQDKGLDSDKTNLAARQKLVDDAFDKQNLRLKEMNAKGRFPSETGVTYEQALQISNEARQAERDRVALDTAKNILDQAERQRTERFQQLQNELRAQGITGAAANARSAALVAEFKPIVEDAAKKANEALATRRGPETQDTRTLRERINLAQSTAARPPQVDEIQQAAITQSQKAVDDINKERQARFEAIIEKEKSGALKLNDAVKEVAEVISSTAPRQAAAIETANKELRAIRDAPGTNELRKGEIDRIIAQNNASRAKEQEYLDQVVQAGLKDSLEERDRIIAALDAKLAAIAKDTKLSPAEAARRIVEITLEANKALAAAITKVGENIRAALSLPNLTPGARQALTAAQAQNEGVQTTGLPQVRAGIDTQMAQLKELQQSTKDVHDAYAELLKIGRTTPEEMAAKEKEAFEKANVSAKPLIESLRTQIDLFEKMGGKAGDVAKLRAELEKTGASLNYASDFTKAFTKTLEDSLANRGMQAIDSIAQSIGNVIGGLGTWKDVISNLGTAFANFAAGVLKDLATMIIKLYLFKMIQTAVGGYMGIPVAHEGGTVGAVGGARREVDMSIFHYARRMHDGGGVGFANDEMPMILQRGEKVVSIAEQKMQAARASTGAGGQTGIRNVLAVGDKEIAGAMNGAHGERVIMNVLARNAPTVKKYIG